jgi:hypothetical protein
MAAFGSDTEAVSAGDAHVSAQRTSHPARIPIASSCTCSARQWKQANLEHHSRCTNVEFPHLDTGPNRIVEWKQDQAIVFTEKMVQGVVSGEPVSGPNSLLTPDFQGISAISWEFVQSRATNSAANSVACRVNSLRIGTGKFARLQGHSEPVTGIASAP